MPTELTAERKRKCSTGDLYKHKQPSRVAGNGCDRVGFLLELVGDRPDAASDPIVMRGNNMAAVSWVSRSDGTIDKRACLLIHESARAP